MLGFRRERCDSRRVESFRSDPPSKPELVLVSAGFTAYVHDPITAMMLVREDFFTLGRRLRASRMAATALPEGGYSQDLPVPVAALPAGWSGEERAA